MAFGRARRAARMQRPAPRFAGRSASAVDAPAWTSLLVNDQFVDIGAAQSMVTWANAGGIPSASYRPASATAIASIIDGYSDPASDDEGQYFNGGGHGDGTCDAVVKLDFDTLEWSLVGDPTPPSKYHPNYIDGSTSAATILNYPSGAYHYGGAISQSPRHPPHPYGYFLTEAEGLDPVLDASMIAPRLSRMTTHMYGAVAKRGDVLHCFYLTYGEFNVVTGEWSTEGYETDIGGQLAALSGSFGSLTNEPQAPGTYAHYDATTDRFFVTCNSQDRSAGNRKGIFVFDPTTRQIESYSRPDGLGGPPILGSTPMVAVGRDLWIFTRPDIYLTSVSWNQGFIYNMDSQTWSQFEIQGDPAATYMDPSNTVAECLPCYYDGTRIVRWNYYVDPNKVHIVNTTPVSGAGTSASPYVFAQTERAISGAPSFSKLVYKRLHWLERAGCAVLVPEATAKPVALKLS